MLAKTIEESYGLITKECADGIKVISPNDQLDVKQFEDNKIVVESYGPSIVYSVGNFENDFCIN